MCAYASGETSEFLASEISAWIALGENCLGEIFNCSMTRLVTARVTSKSMVSRLTMKALKALSSLSVFVDLTTPNIGVRIRKSNQ